MSAHSAADENGTGSGSPLLLRLFGPFEAWVRGAPLPPLRSRRGHWLLALLTLRYSREVERGWLAGTLWPDNTQSEALYNLRRNLADLRRALGAEAGRIRSPTPHTLLLDLTGADADVVAFDAAIEALDASALPRAAALYRGPLLEGWTEEWVFEERQPREQRYLQVLEALAADAHARGDLGEAERHLRRTVVVDPLRESAQRALMATLAAGGNDAAALLAYRELRLRLHRELNTEPSTESQALFQRLRAQAREKAALGSANERQRGEHARLALGKDDDGPHADRPADTRPSTKHHAPCAGSAATLTFLLTDVEGSTRHWLDHLEAMRQTLARHDELAAAVIEQHAGLLVKQRGEGDSLFAVFPRATDAVAASLELQRAFARESWPGDLPLKVRIALHTGEAEVREGDYYGLAVNHGARLRAVGHGGQVLLSQTTAALARDALPADAELHGLGAHRLKDLLRAEPIFQLTHPELPSQFPPLRSLEAFAHNLPVQLTSFIGREQEIAEVKRRLPSTPLLTLTGTGGCGKTRLALHVAADLVGEYEDGVWLVELAALSNPGLVPQTVAAALGVREEAYRPLIETLTDALRSRRLLLVLDNCEHLLSTCAGLAEALLQRGPNLRILATSREGLRIAGETTYRVPPLSVPELKRLPPAERLTQYEAIQLFVERALAAQPSFTLTEQNAAAVVQVCQRLDGIPLAIELAAAWVKALPVGTLNERLDDMFRLLTGGSRTALPRQQTLRALIDWSYDLLSPSEQTLLCRLSVFAGGWTLEAAETVCVGEGVEEWEVLDRLTSLVEKSLVLYEEQGGEGRYRLLETVRQYARDRLLGKPHEVGRGEAAGVRERHRAWCLGLAEQRVEGESETAWLDRLEREHDNLRTALAWSRVEGSAEAGLRLGGALEWFWRVRGYVTEGREQLAGLLALPGAEAPTAARAKALDRAHWLAVFQGDFGAARALLEESLAICRELEDKRGIHWSLYSLGRVAQVQGDHGTARARFEESLAICRELGFKGGICEALLGLAWVAQSQGDNEMARALLDEARPLDPGAYACMGRGNVLLAMGDDAAARSCYEEGLALQRAAGDTQGTAAGLVVVGHVAWLQGEHGITRSNALEALALFQERGDKEGLLMVLESLGVASLGQGRKEQAARLLGAVEALREALELPAAPFWRHPRERIREAARAAALEQEFAAAWAAGRALSLDEAVAFALDETGGC